jgi:PhoPQ-activated pathogenicity-related protein
MNESRVSGPRGDLWDHQMIVIVPKKFNGESKATMWMNNGCNNDIQPPTKSNADMVLVDEVAHNTNAIAVIVR